MQKLLLPLLATFLLLHGCAKPPAAELRAARGALAQASEAGAPEYAPTEWQVANEALRDGEDLIREGKYVLAREILPFAAAHAHRALLKTQEERANRELEKIRRQQQEQQQQEQEQPAEGQPEAKPPPTRQTIQAITAPPPAAKPPPPPSKPKPSAPLPREYRVGEGETLWTIAARQEVYADGMLWPLLYQANRDQIKDPRQIYPGQTLSIPRRLSAAAKEEAREKARRSRLFISPEARP